MIFISNNFISTSHTHTRSLRFLGKSSLYDDIFYFIVWAFSHRYCLQNIIYHAAFWLYNTTRLCVSFHSLREMKMREKSWPFNFALKIFMKNVSSWKIKVCETQRVSVSCNNLIYILILLSTPSSTLIFI